MQRRGWPAPLPPRTAGWRHARAHGRPFGGRLARPL